MQEIWSEESQAIRAELDELIAGRTELTLFQQGQTPQKLRAKAIEQGSGGEVLLLEKIVPFQAPPNISLVLYHPPGQLMRGFPAVTVTESDGELGIALPGRIIQIQRRRHPRINAGPNSTVTFTKLGSQAINNGHIKDVSLEGVNLTGPFSEHIRKDDRLSPLTLTMRLKFGNYEESILIADSVVRRRKELGKGQLELGVHFTLAKNDLDRLDTYLTLRTMELEALALARGNKV
ncbi:MAG: PilZ domain-containing protein [Thermodesulfobacteriota bacterium]